MTRHQYAEAAAVGNLVCKTTNFNTNFKDALEQIKTVQSAGHRNSDIKKLARRAGNKVVAANVFEALRAVKEVWDKEMLRTMSLYAQHANRTRLTAVDATFALRRKGLRGYGCKP